MAKLAAFAAIYLIWGSTYLAIKVGVETLPPFLLGGVRFLLAGIPLYAWARLRGAPAPTWRNWRAAAGVGALLLVGGNGMVIWSEQFVDSGVASLVVALVPVFLVILERLGGGDAVPRSLRAGVVIGFLGVAALMLPARGVAAINPIGLAGLLIASLSWAMGSLRSRRANLPANARLAAATQMLAGGAGLLLLATLTGEWGRLDVGNVSSASLLALGYLVVMGAIVGFSAYLWLLRVCAPSSVGTYAFVNPVVALLLGAGLAGEPLGARTLLASLAILGAVILIHFARRRGRRYWSSLSCSRKSLRNLSSLGSITTRQ